ncbi:hypothetical protein F183_A16840 [Bryobacterales bacterium F-183]|nr:hypothetical protein F183_A16840 [Bryobacterales bacterium F-183]
MRILPWLYLVGSRQFGLSSPWDCHIYALRRDHGGILLIDAGSGLANSRIIANLKAEFGDPLPPVTILVTHHHPDHAAGTAPLARELNAEVCTSDLTAPILTAGQSDNPGYPEHMVYAPCLDVRTYRPGATLDLQGFTIETIPVRGHSEDSVAFLLDGEHLFSADIVFYGGLLGLINAPGSDLTAYRQDLPKLAGRNIQGFFPSHGLFTIEDGQQHIDTALIELQKGFVPRAIGQGDLIF